MNMIKAVRPHAIRETLGPETRISLEGIDRLDSDLLPCNGRWHPTKIHGKGGLFAVFDPTLLLALPAN